MGLFSSKEEVPSPVNRTYSQSRAYGENNYSAQNENARQVEQMLRIHRQQELQRQREQAELIYQFQRLSVSKPTVVISVHSFQPIPVKIDPSLVYEFLENQNNTNLNNDNLTYKITSLENNSWEFSSIKRLFTSTNKKCFSVHSIEKVNNPYLLAQYNLMQIRYKKRYGHTSEQNLFHGTREDNIGGICTYNFDWRLKGSARGHIFGQGVSFTPISNYATNYGDKTFEKIMIVAKVLISNKCIGNKDTVLPPANCDTTTKDNEHVLVKYEDNTFYPAYIIHYRGIDTTKPVRRYRQWN